MSKKLRFGKYDVIIVIMVVLCIVGLLFRNNASSAVSGLIYNDTARIHFTVSETDKSVLKAIQAGDTFYFSNGSVFGTLMEGYMYENSEKTTFSDDGSTGKMILTEKYDVTGDFTSDGRFTDNGFLCSGTKIFVNSDIELHSKNAVITIKVTKIENVSEQNSVQ